MNIKVAGALAALFLYVAAARGQVIAVTLETTDLADAPIASIASGERFKLRVLVEDLRTPPQGVFAAYLDVEYPAAQVTPIDPLTFGSDYPNGQQGQAVGGLIDDGGAFGEFTPLGGGALLLFEQVFEATAPGVIMFSANEADEPPGTDFLLFGAGASIDPADVEFGAASVNVVPAQDLRDFADTDGAYFGLGGELGSSSGFNYIDISPDSIDPGPGIDLGLSGDDVGTVIDLEALAGRPLSFRVYDQLVTALQVTSNGVIGDPGGVNGAGDFSNDCRLPASPSTGTGFRIYPHHDDLDLTSGGAYYRYFDEAMAAGFGFLGEDDGISVLQWEGSYFGSSDRVDFQAVLGHTTQRIVFQYRDVDRFLGSATVGIQNGDASIGVNVACDDPRVVEDRVVVLEPGDLQFSLTFAPGNAVVGGTSVPQVPPGELLFLNFFLLADVDASGVTLQSTLPQGLALLEASVSRGTFDPLTGLWDVGFMGAGQAASIEFMAEQRFSPGTTFLELAGATTVGGIPLGRSIALGSVALASERGVFPFGDYRFVTDAAQAPPPFLSFHDLFVDLVGLGTQVIATNSDNVFSAPLPLVPFFEFYGTQYGNLLISSNGFISFDMSEVDADFSNACPLPDALFPRILALHDDLVLDAAGTGVWYQTDAVAMHPDDAELRPATIIQWDEVRHFGGVETWDMEVILFHDSGDILLLLGAGNLELGDSSSVGIQAGVPDPLAALIYQCGDELVPAPGSLPGSQDFAIFFEAPEPPPVAVNLILDSASGTEQDETRVTVSVVADEPVNGDQDIELTFSGASPADLAQVAGKGMPKLVIADGATTASRTFRVVDDDEVEGPEEATFRIFGPSPGLTLGPITELPFAIIDDDVPGLAIGDADAEEADGTLTFTVTLSGASPGPFTVPMSILPGSATAGSDFVDSPGMLSFAGTVGETQSFAVSIIGDAVVELDETLSVVLGAPSNPLVMVDDDTGSGTIRNDDSATITIADLSAEEGDSGEQEFMFAVTLDRAVDVQIVLEFRTADGTATTADGDYLLSEFPLGFNGTAGEVQLVPVPVVGDERVEPDETFELNLFNLFAAGRAVTIADATGLATIINDDAPPPNEPPEADDAIFDLTGDAANGTAVGTVSARDPNGPLPATGAFAITAGDPGGAFAIDDAGLITVADAAALPDGGTAELSVTVSDGELSDTATIRIRIGDRIFSDGYELIAPPPRSVAHALR